MSADPNAYLLREIDKLKRSRDEWRKRACHLTARRERLRRNRDKWRNRAYELRQSRDAWKVKAGHAARRGEDAQATSRAEAS